MSIEITAVERDVKKKSRYHLYAGSDEPILSVHEDLLIRYKLLKGQIISEAELETIRAEDQQYAAYALALNYLSFRSCTKKQIEQYLRRKEIEPAHIAFAIERLESANLVDDEEYARQFASQRIRYGQKGRRWIKQELQQKGVSKQAAAKAAEEIDRDEEKEAAIAAASKKWRSLKGEPADKRRKLLGFLLRRGFPGDIVQEAVRTAMAEEKWDAFDDDDGLMLDN